MTSCLKALINDKVKSDRFILERGQVLCVSELVELAWGFMPHFLVYDIYSWFSSVISDSARSYLRGRYALEYLKPMIFLFSHLEKAYTVYFELASAAG